MANPETRLSCFIASPGDCADERKIAAAAVQRIDSLIGKRLHWRMESHVWENDAFPDFGRPQAIINKILDGSDIAIFIFWHRLGTEAGQGLTGAEEEFYRALQRRHAAREPRILLYFNEAPFPRHIDLDQLKSLQDFRRRIDDSGKLLYGTFLDRSEWRERLEDALAEEVFRRFKEAESSTPRTTNEAPVLNARGEDGQALLLRSMLAQLREQVQRLEIIGDDPEALKHLRREIDRLERLKKEK